MDLGYAFLANYAELTPDGHFSAVNAGIDGFVVEKLPERIVQKAIVAYFRFMAEECDRDYEVTLSLTEPDGQELVFDGSSRVSPRRDEYFPDRPGGINVIFPIYSWEIRREGIYVIRMYVNSVYSGELTLGIVHRPSEQDGGQ